MQKFSRAALLKALIPGLVLSLSMTGCKDPNAGKSTDASGNGSTTTSTAAVQDTTGDTINVGQYASLTGETSTFGVESNAGLTFAVDEINAAGGIEVGGKKMLVKVETQDDQSKADEAKTIAVKYAGDAKIVAVIGEVASSRSKTAAPEFQRAGIPMISPSSTNPDVTKVGDHIFRVCFIDPFQGYVMAKFATEELKLKKVAILRDPSQDYSVGLADVFKEEFTKMGGEIVADASYNAKDSDFRSQLGQIKTAAADGIFIPGYYNEVGTIARQAKELSITVPLMGGDGWDSEKLVEGAGGPGKALEGAYFSTHYSKDSKDQKVQDFVKAFTAKTGKAPASLVAQGYDAMMILADAIKRAGSIERKKVRDALAQTKDYVAVTGKITIDENRNANKSAVVLQISGAEFKYVKTVDPK
ncbi:ABC transporter substrate-binding protein [Armatimonas sp.]|uniref:ABC transporter substrate-binding protein n=1 Tax=Armatimonas sp. TaxID=1872638 RepID=UPI00286CE0E7|nr:ABC transporter substrate-binding protein [Armatimonas sp.]